MTIEAMKQALEALDGLSEPYDVLKAQHALRTAIAEAEKQEPVAWQGVHDQTDLYYRKPPQADVRPLYTTPPEAQKEHKQMNGKQSPAPWNTPATSVQEPVAWANINKHGDITHTNNKRMPWSKTPLYTTPPAQPAKQEPVAWLGLEPSDMPDGDDLMYDHDFFLKGMAWADAILRKKNTTPPAAQRQPLTEEQINQYDYEYRDILYDVEKMLRDSNT